MKHRLLTLLILIGIAPVSIVMLNNDNNNLQRPTRNADIQEDGSHEEDENEEMNKDKTAPWTVENAAHHQQQIKKYMSSYKHAKAQKVHYADGAISGEWRNRGAKNMPGAFKFTEMLDGTDTIYGVTHNHFSGEYNSKSYIFKGTVYNPKSGTMGDDFVRLTGHWPNRYKDLIAINYNAQTRLIAGIENGPLYYSDNEGKTWHISAGLPGVLISSIANRQLNKIYTTDGTSVYVSTNGGESFTLFQNFGYKAASVLYSPRYSVQPKADWVYLARNGKFYSLSSTGSEFVEKGMYTDDHDNFKLSIGGDDRKLYVTVNNNYWVSTDGGVNWIEKFPTGNYYGNQTGKMSVGKYLAANPLDPDYIIGGYTQPVYSSDGLNSNQTDQSGWSHYQGGTHLSVSDYHDRIRFNYHPDFQASQFFFNSSGDLFSIRSSDGGLLMSYKDWFDLPINGNLNNDGYTNSHFINITTLNTTCALIYRNNMFTGHKDEKHIFYGTQDQGSQNTIPGTSGESLNFYQSLGGDGPPITSADGKHVWRYQPGGDAVYIPAPLYDSSGKVKSASKILRDTYNNPKVTFFRNTKIKWVQTHVDHDAPAERMWVLSTRLDRAEVNNGNIIGSSISKGTGYQVTAIAQGHADANLVWFLQEAKVYKSYDRGDSFDNGVSTPFSKTLRKRNYGDGWTHPTNNNLILFNGPSANGVGSILSKNGGISWQDVTGNYPAGDDQQTGGMIGTPDGKYVFAGTDIGPWVFVVATETWYPIGDGAAYFNTTAIEYIKSTNTVRFGTWGSGVWDFSIENKTADMSPVHLLLLD